MKTKKGLGCLSFFSILLISLIGSSFISFFISISVFNVFAILLLLFSWLIGKIDVNANQVASYRYLKYSFIILGILFGFRYSSSIGIVDQNYSSDISEHIYREKYFEKGDSILLLSQKRKWIDNYGNTFQGNFSVREKDYVSSRKRFYEYTDTSEFIAWNRLYNFLAKSDTPNLDLILKKLFEIKIEHKLDQLAFADMIVSFIQDIPYSFVFNGACESAEKYEESIRVILEKCSDCCIGNIPYGIQNPVAFLGNLKGDCDTRTVIIYSILGYFGYDVAILNSEYYKHSILGLHVPTNGVYKVYSGKRYYVWETTNKYYTIGTLPNTINNMNHWDVILTNTTNHEN